MQNNSLKCLSKFLSNNGNISQRLIIKNWIRGEITSQMKKFEKTQSCTIFIHRITLLISWFLVQANDMSENFNLDEDYKT